MDNVLEAVKNIVPQWLKLHVVYDIQVLTPRHRGVVESEHSNKELQELLNSNEVKLNRGSRSFRIDDKVMQIENIYERDFFISDDEKDWWPL